MTSIALRVNAALVALSMAHSAFAQTPTAPVRSVSPSGDLAAATDSSARDADVVTGAPELVTDRPDFTESSEVVGHGVLQVETGFTFESDRAGDVSARSITTPAVLARIGVGRRFEVRLGGEGFLRGWTSAPGGTAVSGFSDVEVGAKVKLVDRAAFDVAVIPIVSVPTNDAHYSSGTYDSTVKLTWAAPLPRDFGLSGNLNVSSLSDELGRFAQQAVSVSLAHDLMGGWGGYWEAYAFTPMERGLGAGWTANTGVTRGIGQNMQFDVELGRGLTAVAPDWFFGVGFAVRSPIASRR